MTPDTAADVATKEVTITWSETATYEATVKVPADFDVENIDVDDSTWLDQVDWLGSVQEVNDRTVHDAYEVTDAPVAIKED